MKKNKMNPRDLSAQYVRIKIDNKEYYQQLSTMIKQASQLQIISESFDEIVIVSKQRKQAVHDLFPKIKTLDTELSLFEHKKNKRLKKLIRFFAPTTKSKQSPEIINISGVLINEG